MGLKQTKIVIGIFEFLAFGLNLKYPNHIIQVLQKKILHLYFDTTRQNATNLRAATTRSSLRCAPFGCSEIAGKEAPIKNQKKKKKNQTYFKGVFLVGKVEL